MVLVLVASHHRLETGNRRKSLQRLLDLGAADEHSLHLHGVADAPDEPGELRCGPQARARVRRREDADVAGGEAQ